MKLIVGLGNPGRKYAPTRHNIGARLVKLFCRSYRVKLAREKAVCSFLARVKIKEEEVILAIPQTFMNLSGRVVAALLKKYKLGLSDLLVVCDDLDLDFGRLRIKPCGSSGGHRGLSSIIEALKENNFCRLRVGIGRPSARDEAADYVLRPFSRGESLRLGSVLKSALRCSQVWLNQGVSAAMSSFNKKDLSGAR
jgi:PTH1 family peptidyl-tRNA hydrolase